jgi:hypothetical protein
VPNKVATLTQGALDRWLFLSAREAAAAAIPVDRRARVRALHAAGRKRYDDALGTIGGTALVLARASVACFLEAVVVARSASEPREGESVEALWALHSTMVDRGQLAPLPARYADARMQSTSRALADLEVASLGDARIDEALALADHLASSVEAHSPAWVRGERAARFGLLLLFAAFLGKEAAPHRPRSPSFCLHATVAASSRRPENGPPESLTNGTVEPTLAFATREEADPSVTVDLVIPRTVSAVWLWTSDDHPDDSLPLRVETSADGDTWQAGATSKDRFSSSDPAVLSFARRPTRYVRVHGRPGGALYLNEVEVR